MKFLQVLCSVVVFLVFEQTAFPQSKSPEQTFRSRIDDAKREYRLAKSAEFRQATHVVIYVLDSSDLVDTWDFDEADPRFELPSGQFAKVVDRKESPVCDHEKMLSALRDDLGVKEVRIGTMCHLPTHGLQLIVKSSDPDKTKVLFSASLSTQTNNMVHAFPDGDECESLTLHAPARDELLRVMPIPASLQPAPKEDIEESGKQPD